MLTNKKNHNWKIVLGALLGLTALSQASVTAMFETVVTQVTDITTAASTTFITIAGLSLGVLALFLAYKWGKKMMAS